MSRKTLKEFELEVGIEIKNKHKDYRYSKDELKKLIKTNYITVKTEKGLEYISDYKKQKR